MRWAIAIIASFVLTLTATAQVNEGPREIVLPSPELIHCRQPNCSQLWKQQPLNGHAAYPAQVLTDFVDGEVVGLTAVYDKSISAL